MQVLYYYSNIYIYILLRRRPARGELVKFARNGRPAAIRCRFELFLKTRIWISLAIG